MVNSGKLLHKQKIKNMKTRMFLTIIFRIKYDANLDAVNCTEFFLRVP